MTGPRRAKDGPRVRHLRTLATASSGGSGIGFIGFRTDRFEEMVALFRDLIGLGCFGLGLGVHRRRSLLVQLVVHAL